MVTMSRSRVFEWFRDGRESTEDDERSDRPRSSRNDENVEKVQALVRSDRRMTIEMIADSLNLSVGFVFTIITEDLKKRKLCARFVPHSLTEERTSGYRLQRFGFHGQSKSKFSTKHCNWRRVLMSGVRSGDETPSAE